MRITGISGQPISQQSGDLTVQPGETLSSIAEKLGVSESDLASTNNLAPVAQLKPGQQLNIPQTKQNPPIHQGISSARDSFETAKDLLAKGIIVQSGSRTDPGAKGIWVQSEGRDSSLDTSKLAEEIRLKSQLQPPQLGMRNSRGGLATKASENQVSLIPKRTSSDLDLQGVEQSVVSATIPDNVEALLKLLPPATNVKDFLDAVGKYFPKLDKDGNGKVTMSELTDAMKSWEFPPLDFAGLDGFRLLRVLTNMDPKLQALLTDLCQCKNPEDYAMVNKQITARTCELLKAVYKGTPVTIQDISTTDPWKSDDILFNGQVMSLTHQVANFTDPVEYFDGGWKKQEEWLQMGPTAIFDPHVGSDVGQEDAD